MANIVTITPLSTWSVREFGSASKLNAQIVSKLTSLDSNYQLINSGSSLLLQKASGGPEQAKLAFIKSAAPTGWTRVSGDDNVLRVTDNSTLPPGANPTTVGGQVGGGWSLSGMSLQVATGHSHTFSHYHTMGNHTHTMDSHQHGMDHTHSGEAHTHTTPLNPSVSITPSSPTTYTANDYGSPGGGGSETWAHTSDTSSDGDLLLPGQNAHPKALAQPIVFDKPGTITSISLRLCGGYIHTPYGSTFVFRVWSDSSGSPGAVVGSSSSILIVYRAFSNYSATVSINIPSAGTYWIGAQGNGSAEFGGVGNTSSTSGLLGFSSYWGSVTDCYSTPVTGMSGGFTSTIQPGLLTLNASHDHTVEHTHTTGGKVVTTGSPNVTETGSAGTTTSTPDTNDTSTYSGVSVENTTHTHNISHNGLWRPRYLNTLVCGRD